jgi:peroxiredoxin
MDKNTLKKTAIAFGLMACLAFAVACGATVRPTVATGYDWAATNKILVLGISELKQSPEIGRTLTHRLFETGLPVEQADIHSVLDMYEVGREHGADVIAYGELSEVDVYYPHHRSGRHSTYPIKTVEVELQFIETETRRKIWKGSGSLEDSAHIADEFLVNKLLAEMVEDIVPQWEMVPRATTDVPMLKIGTRAPLFEIQDLKGDPYALKNDLGQKVVVLNFWSFFCGQCREEIRLLDDIHRQFARTDVSIIAVTIEGAPLTDRIKDYVGEAGYGLKFLLDEHSNGGYEVADSYKIPGTPALYVIGKSGTIAFARSGHITSAELLRVIESELRKG